ncbi:MAG: YhbY family RNA-binding protein [Atopobiaceae bacterium]|jgi:RNA-binding protein
MELTGRQIRQLRALANRVTATIAIGKAGVDAVITQTDRELEAHELIKCSVQNTSPIGVKEASLALARRTQSEVVQVIGKKFVLYRPSERDDIERIQLV